VAEQVLEDMFRSGMFAPRSGKKQTEMSASYDDGDPRLRLSSAQWMALRPVIRGDPIAAISTRCRTSPNRVRRWLKSPIFRRAVAAEIAKPTEERFRLSITLSGVQEANTLRRERAAAKELEAGDEQG
jgi:hypothetical protein